MTDTEKRAHDIAVAVMATVASSKLRLNETAVSQTPVDFYKLYKDAYDTAIKAVQQNFS